MAVPWRCQNASKRMSEPATPAFNDSLFPDIAMVMDSSHRAMSSSLKPLGLVAHDDDRRLGEVDAAMITSTRDDGRINARLARGEVRQGRLQ